VRVVVTGSKGFIGRNLMVRLSECPEYAPVGIDLETSPDARSDALASADVVVHLAGVNRPPSPNDYKAGNAGATQALCDELLAIGRPVPIVFSSSAQAVMDNPYGLSKRDAESAVTSYGRVAGTGYAVLRLWNVFGKWAQPQYNSVVATFCHNVARNLPVDVHDPSAPLRLVYIDDVVDAILALVGDGVPTAGEVPVGPVHETTVGELLSMVHSFAAVRRTRDVPRVGSGFERKLYATYLSYLPPEDFAYSLPAHRDTRGMFAEMLRTADSGQFSVFTAHPGVTRGGHFHHTKNEKFFVIHGRARFGFRDLRDDAYREITVDAAEPQVVDTVPGWVHDITNVGDDLLIVLLWANEAFDPSHADTTPAFVRL
jgi:UDP-2-acetamido-2,6-beta-L-arabino-hexul-4-ose reductase